MQAAGAPTTTTLAAELRRLRAEFDGMIASADSVQVRAVSSGQSICGLYLRIQAADNACRAVEHTFTSLLGGRRQPDDTAREDKINPLATACDSSLRESLDVI